MLYSSSRQKWQFDQAARTSWPVRQRHFEQFMAIAGQVTQPELKLEQQLELQLELELQLKLQLALYSPRLQLPFGCRGSCSCCCCCCCQPTQLSWFPLQGGPLIMRLVLSIGRRLQLQWIPLPSAPPTPPSCSALRRTRAVCLSVCPSGVPGAADWMPWLVDWRTGWLVALPSSCSLLVSLLLQLLLL